MVTNELTDQLALFFKDKPVKRAFLFGSAARKESTPQSDLDILVDLDYENGADFFTFLDMQEQLSVLVGVPVDLVSSNGLSEFIKPIIDEEKRLIYEKKLAF
ncbi:MAG: nucleotidyltransferase [Cytophagaceae bacterium SCN 52-12]|nr:MAG: nucleotidyltransferase [Cytophagaceae bacterium SCN 52-12]